MTRRQARDTELLLAQRQKGMLANCPEPLSQYVRTPSRLAHCKIVCEYLEHQIDSVHVKVKYKDLQLLLTFSHLMAPKRFLPRILMR